MYRNISYSVENRQGYIHLDTWNSEGERETIKYPWYSYLYYEHPNGEYTSMFNTPLRKEMFQNVFDRHKWLKNHPHLKKFECLTPIREFLINKFAGKQELSEFTQFPLQTYFLDIEVAVEDEFPEPDAAEYPINLITIFDSLSKKYHCWYLYDEDLFENTKEKVFHHCTSEYELLSNFVDWFVLHRPDIIAGWNILLFDIPYIVNRIERLLGRSKDLSPVKKIIKNQHYNKKMDRTETTFTIEGLSCLDQLILYRDKFEIRDPLSQYNLDFIGEHELGETKLKYNGSFKDFYQNDFKLFVEYNIRDVELCVKIEEKKKHIELTRLICNYGLCEYECIYKSAPYILGALILQGISDNKVVITNNNIETTDSTFQGAFVYPTIPGIYRKGIASFDLNSLYPNIMITCNISPETKVGKIVEEYNDGSVVLKLTNNTTKLLKNEKYQEILGKCYKSANGVLYLKKKHKEGLIPKFLSRLYEGRIDDKNKIYKLENQLSKLDKRSKEAKDLNIQIENLDGSQFAKKIFLNSIYGSLGSRYFPMFDLDNAEAVTITGQQINIPSGKFLNTYINKKYNPDEPVNLPIAGDTDSIYLKLDPLVDALCPNEDINKEENIEKICNELDNVITPQLNKFVGLLCQKQFNADKDNITIEYKREKFSSEGLFESKKHYALHVRNDEGKLKDEFKYTGIELKKSNHPPIIKDYLKRIYDGSLVEPWDSNKYKEVISDIWQDFKNKSEDEIALYQGYNTEKEAEGFLSIAKGTHRGAKACIFYNQLISELGLKGKYPEIRGGNKIRIADINKNNPYGIDVIAWPAWETLPPELSSILEIDYKTLFHKNVLGPLKHVIELNKWRVIDPCDEQLVDIMSL